MRQFRNTKYFCTPAGQIFDMKKNKMIKPYLNRLYHYVNINDDGVKKCYRLHRVIWEAFHGPIPSNLEVDHIDNNKLNNSIGNLQLLTHRENIIKYHKDKENANRVGNSKAN